MRVSGTFRSNSGHTLLQAVRAGIGIAMGPDWLMHDLLASGEVRVILPEYSPKALDISAVYPSNRLLSAKVRAFVEFLQQEFAQISALNAKD